MSLASGGNSHPASQPPVYLIHLFFGYAVITWMRAQHTRSRSPCLQDNYCVFILDISVFLLLQPPSDHLFILNFHLLLLTRWFCSRSGNGRKRRRGAEKAKVSSRNWALLTSLVPTVEACKTQPIFTLVRCWGEATGRENFRLNRVCVCVSSVSNISNMDIGTSQIAAYRVTVEVVASPSSVFVLILRQFWSSNLIQCPSNMFWSTKVWFLPALPLQGRNHALARMCQRRWRCLSGGNGFPHCSARYVLKAVRSIDMGLQPLTCVPAMYIDVSCRRAGWRGPLPYSWLSTSVCFGSTSPTRHLDKAPQYIWKAKTLLLVWGMTDKLMID